MGESESQEQSGSQKWLIALLMIFGSLIFLKMPVPQKAVKAADAGRSLAPQVQAVPEFEPTPVAEQPPGERLKLKRPNWRRVKPVQKKVKPPPPEPKKAPVAKAKPAPPKPKPKSYPKAKPRQVNAPKPQPQQIAAAVNQGRPEPGQDDEVRLEIGGELSWKSLPASGPPINGHLKITVEPPKAKGKERTYRNVMVLIDVSGSMRVNATRIATPIILMMERLDPKDRVAVVAFASRAKVFASNTNLATYERELRNVMASGTTNLVAGMGAAVQEFKKGKRPNREDKFVVLTDGLVGGASEELRSLNLAQAAGTPITVLGYGYQYNYRFLQEMATKTGGEFTYVSSVSQLLDTVMGDVTGLSGVITRNNVLIIDLKAGVKASQAYVVGRDGRELGRVKVVNQRAEIPLGDVQEGQKLEVVVEVVLPKGEVGVVEIAEAKLEYIQPDGSLAQSAASKVKLKYDESYKQPKRNPSMRDVVIQTSNARRNKRY